MKLSNKTYDILKRLSMVVLPAVATMCITIANIWGIPYGEEISATIMAINTCLGIVLGISTKQYNKTIAEE